MEDFAELLKTSRVNWKPKKISLKKLADAIDNICSDAFLSQLENRRYKGKKGELMRPGKDIVIALAKFFNWNLNEALKLAGHSPVDETAQEEQERSGLTDDSREIIEALNKLSAKSLKAVTKPILTIISTIVEVEASKEDLQFEDSADRAPEKKTDKK